MKELTLLYTNAEELQKFLNENNFFTNQKCLIKFFSSKLNKDELEVEIKNIKSILPNSDLIGSSSCNDVIFNSEIYNKASFISISTVSTVQPKILAFSWLNLDQKDILNELIKAFNTKTKPIHLIFSNTAGNLYDMLDKFIHSSNISDPVLKFVGGVAGNINSKSYVFFNEEIYENGVLALSLENNDNIKPVSSFLHTSVTNEIISDYFEITNVDDRAILEIENTPALEWFYNYFNILKDKCISIDEFKKIANDEYFTNFTIISNKHNEAARFIDYNCDNNKLSLTTSKLTTGSKFQVGYLNPKKVLKESYELCGSILLNDIENLFIYSCGIRKSKLENAVKLELASISKNNICGIFMLGEFCYYDDKNIFYNGSSCCIGIAENFNRLLIDTSILDENKIVEDLTHYDLAMEKQSQIINEIDDISNEKYIDNEYDMKNSLKYKHDLLSGMFDKIAIIEVLTADATIAHVGQEKFVESCKETFHNVLKMVNDNNMDDYIDYYILNYKTFIQTGSSEIDDEQFIVLMKNMYEKFNITTSTVTNISAVARFVVVLNQNDMLRVGTSVLYSQRSSQENFIICYKDNDEEDDLVDESFYLELLKNAIDNGNIVPHYQGMRNNKTGIIDKYEALMRITQNGKTYYPDSFMDIAKKFKLYNKISRIMIEQVLNEFEFRSEAISINVSLYDIESTEFREFLLTRLSSYPRPYRVVVEFLETEDCKDLNLMKEFIKDLHDIGTKIAIDDFGSGYSTFATIANLNPDFIKIDGSIVSGISTNETNLKIMNTICHLAKSMNIKTIAEYVDNYDVQKLVEKNGVDHSQGFLFSKPSLLD